MILQQGNIQSVHGIPGQYGRPGCQPIPFPVQKHAELPLSFRAVRRFRSFLHQEPLGNLLQKGLFIVTLQIFYYAVVIHDVQLFIRKQYRQKIIEFFLPGVIRIGRPAHQTNLYCRSTAVMAVCNVNRIHLLKLPPNDRKGTFLLPYDPHLMAHTVLRHKSTGRGLFLPCTDHVTKHRICPVCQENRACLHIAHIHMADSVLFFVRPGIFMLFDNIVPVVIYGGACHNPCLAPAVHSQFIQIIAGLSLFYKAALADPLLQQRGRPPVHLLRISVHLRAEPCLCAVYRQKRIRIPFGLLRGFLSVIYVIGQGSNFAFQSRRRTVSGKRSDICHLFVPLFLSDFPFWKSVHSDARISFLFLAKLMNHIVYPESDEKIRNFCNSIHNKIHHTSLLSLLLRVYRFIPHTAAPGSALFHQNPNKPRPQFQSLIQLR